jgi:predicted acylesterase/phospholipase RssA/CRP-like cAMP-binding protein
MADTHVPRTAGSGPEVLRNSPLFNHLTPPQLDGMWREMELLRVAGGETLFAQGDNGDSAYIVISGRLDILLDAGRGPELVNEVTRGNSVGEMALITGDPRSATAVAARDTVLARISKHAFDELVGRMPALALAWTRSLLAHLRRRDQRRGAPRRSRSVLAVIPLHQGLDAGHFGRELGRALGQLGSATWADAAEVDRTLGPATADAPVAGAEHDRFSRWLTDMEVGHDFLVLIADGLAAAWGQRCLRQADAVFLLADADRPPGAVDGSLAGLDRVPRARKELVLLHAGRTMAPSVTARWLDAVGPRRHHHVHAASSPHVERLARLLAGRGVALALGGGGARGFAHIGVYRALVEAGIPVDLVAGTSMGAVIGAQIALGWDAEAIARRTRKGFCESGLIYDLHLPVVSLIAGEKLGGFLHELFGETLVEDVPLPFFCVSSNLTRATVVVHTRGPLWRWIKASGAIPGIAPPVGYEGDLLVDGGLLENLPAARARAAVEGRVIACNVLQSVESSTCSAWPEGTAPLRLLWRHFRPLAGEPIIPTVFDILMRTAFLNHASQVDQVRQSADVYLEPPVSRYNVLDTRPFDEIVQIGYEYTRARIDQIAEALA